MQKKSRIMLLALLLGSSKNSTKTPEDSSPGTTNAKGTFLSFLKSKIMLLALLLGSSKNSTKTPEDSSPCTTNAKGTFLSFLKSNIMLLALLLGSSKNSTKTPEDSSPCTTNAKGTFLSFNKYLVHFLVLTFILISSLYIAVAEPVGPGTMTYVRNGTLATLGAVNRSDINSPPETAGGAYIWQYDIVSTQRNLKWKGYVGNVSGTLALADSLGTLYDWDLGDSFSAEVYASRNASIDWSNINCTWAYQGNLSDIQNRTLEEIENAALGHTNVIDNISATFDGRDNAQFEVGTTTIPANYCYTTNPYTNGTNNAGFFDEVLLSDGFNSTNIIYTSLVESNMDGYSNWNNTNITYDYQMIIPENVTSGFVGVTTYYFYIELS